MLMSSSNRDEKSALFLLWIFLRVLKMQTQIWHKKGAKDFEP